MVALFPETQGLPVLSTPELFPPGVLVSAGLSLSPDPYSLPTHSPLEGVATMEKEVVPGPSSASSPYTPVRTLQGKVD